jgi:hypothetical protein
MRKLEVATSSRLRPQWIIAAFVLYSFGAAQSISAADTQLGVTVGAGQSDNIKRTATDPIDETIFSVGADAAYFRDSKHLYADVLADLSYLDYQNNTFDHEVVGNADAQFKVRLVPGRFDWLFQDHFGQVRSDPFAPVTPDSRENINYFTTGPDATIAFGSQTRLQILAHYSNVNYETSPVDNDRYSASAALIEELSPASFLSLNLRGERVAYKTVSTSDYDSKQAYLRYRLSGNRNDVTVEAGYNQLQFADDTKDGGALFRLDFTHKVSAASQVFANAGYQYTDPSANFASLGSPTTPGNGTDSAAVIQGANPYQNTYGGLGWRFAKQRTGFGVGVTYLEDDYQNNAAQDRKRWGANINFTRRLSPSFTLDLTGDYSQEKFTTPANIFDELSGTARLRWQMARRISADVSYQYFDRTSETGIGGYRENRAWLQLRYGTERTALEARATQSAEAW